MLIRLTCARATANGSQRRGDVIDVPADEAARMIAGRLAEPAEPRQPFAETATTKPPENMDARPITAGRKRGRRTERRIAQ